MPGMDGYELCNNMVKLMEKGDISKFPLIALTAENADDVWELCK